MILDIAKDIITDQNNKELLNILYNNNSFSDNVEELQKKWKEVQNRYIESRTAPEILEDVKEILEALTLEDYQNYINDLSLKVEKLKESGKISTYLYFMEYQTRENFINCYDFINDYVLGFYVGAAEEEPEILEAIESEVNKKVLLWYPEATPEEWREYFNFYTGEALEEIKPRKLEKLFYPVDKVNNKLWKLPEADQKEVLEIMTGKKNKQDINIIVSLDFENSNQETSRELTEYDKLVYIAVASLYQAGNKFMSLSMIHNAMGNTRNPSKDQIQRIDKSLRKMRSTILKISNYQEVQARFKYDLFEYDESLLSFRGCQRKIKGFLYRVIEIKEMPPLLRFSFSRNQITTVDKKLLECPLRNTDENIALKCYLLGYISNCKYNKSLQRKLLFSTICNECGAVERMQKSRIKGKIDRVMTYYQQQDFINSYYFDNDNNLYFNF